MRGHDFDVTPAVIVDYSAHFPGPTGFRFIPMGGAYLDDEVAIQEDGAVVGDREKPSQYCASHPPTNPERLQYAIQRGIHVRAPLPAPVMAEGLQSAQLATERMGRTWLLSYTLPDWTVYLNAHAEPEGLIIDDVLPCREGPRPTAHGPHPAGVWHRRASFQ